MPSRSYGLRSAPLDQGRDDRLIEAIAHLTLGHRDVVPGSDRGSQSGIALGPVGHHKEAIDGRCDVNVLEGVARADALRARVATGPCMSAHRGRLTHVAGDKVVGVSGLDSLHRAVDRPVVE